MYFGIETHLETKESNVQLFLWYLWKCDWIVPSWYYDTAINSRHLYHLFFGFCVIKTILRFCNAFCWNYKYLFSKINKFWAYLSVFMSIICQKVVSNSKYKIESTSRDIKKFSFQLLQFQNNATKSLTLHFTRKKILHSFIFFYCLRYAFSLFIYSKWCRKT